MRLGFYHFKYACFLNGPIWFVNLDLSMSLYIKTFAASCGEFSWNSKWIYGLVSNYISLYNTYRILYKSVVRSHRKKHLWVNNDFLFSRLSWPRALFVSNVAASQPPVKESLYLGIPCLGVVDTNVLADFVSIPFPGNDESIDCIIFYIA